MALGTPGHRRVHPPGQPQPRLTPATPPADTKGKRTQGPVEPRPPGATTGPASLPQNQESRPGPQAQATNPRSRKIEANRTLPCTPQGGKISIDGASCAAGPGVTNLRVFGGVARGQDRPDSDVDLLADRLLEIGEAVKALPAELLDTQPAIPWRQVARMRDHLAHRYFDTDHEVIQATVDEDLPELERAVLAMLAALPEDPAQE
jgi:hypothetical protein